MKIEDKIIIEFENKYKFNPLKKSRKPYLVEARIAIAVFFRSKNYSLQGIEKIIKKDHSNVVYLLKKHDIYFEIDSVYRDKFNNYIEFFNQIWDLNSNNKEYRLKKIISNLENRITGINILGFQCKIWDERLLKLKSNI